MDNLQILPDIYFGSSISIDSIIFGSEKLLLGLPPEECKMQFRWVEKFSHMGEVREQYGKTYYVKPRQLLGITSEDCQELKKNIDISLVEWKSEDIKKQKKH